jgi:hypothetical protein
MFGRKSLKETKKFVAEVVRICIILFTEPPFLQSRNKNEEINKILKFKILVKVEWLLVASWGRGTGCVDKNSPSICLG